jgi:hypothetical protein
VFRSRDGVVLAEEVGDVRENLHPLAGLLVQTLAPV